MRGGRIVQNTSWTFVAFAGRAVLSLVTFTVLLRTLEPTGYGIYAGIVGLVAVFPSLASLGQGDIVTMRIARNADDAPEAWGDALSALAIAGVIATFAVGLIALVVLPAQSTLVVVVLAAGEFLAFGSSDTASRALRALNRFATSALVVLMAAGLRMIAIVSYAALRADETVSDSTQLLFLVAAIGAASIITAIISLATMRSIAGPAQLHPTRWLASARDGAAVGVGHSSQALSSDIDQTLLLRAGFEADNGLYATGARLVQYTFLPAYAFLHTVAPEFFRRGEQGIAHSRAYAKKLALPLVAYAVVMTAFLLLGARGVEIIAGDRFADAAPIIMALSALPMFRAVQSLLGDVLTTTGHFVDRATAVLVSALLNIALNLVLIPQHSWRGAVVATYAAELAMFGILAWSVWRRSRATTY